MEEEYGTRMAKLPPGFQFAPTDDELVLHFLLPRQASLVSSPLHCHSDHSIIPDLITSHHHQHLDPWDLHGKALWNGSQYFYFGQTMQSPITTTSNGFWKDLDAEDPVFTEAGKMVGIKKYLSFHIGEAPTGQETSWVMREYHLTPNSALTRTSGCVPLVLCRVHECKSKSGQCFCCGDDENGGTQLSYMDELFYSLDDNDDLADISSAD